MNHPQKASVINGVGRRKVVKDSASRIDNLNWREPVLTPSNLLLQGWIKEVHEPLLYMHTCLIGHHVEVQKIDGHVYSGIFHAAIMDKEFGVILKMARLIGEDTEGFQGELVKEEARKPPIRTYVIQGKDFVQIIAKDVSLSGDAISNSRGQENRSDILTDAVLSQGSHRKSERELMPWKADDDSCDDTSFNLGNTWSRNWDQFEANKALFGVETTFDEELYTTKLVRGPQMHEMEREAQRIAREIVGQQTRNTHLAETAFLAPRGDMHPETCRKHLAQTSHIRQVSPAYLNLNLSEECNIEIKQLLKCCIGCENGFVPLIKERGVYLTPELELMDEETKYSSVGRVYQDVGDDVEDQRMDDLNDETFGGSVMLVSASVSRNSSSSSPLSGQSDVQENFFLSGDTQIVGTVSRPKNLFDHQDLLSGTVDGGSPECLTDSCKDHLRLRRLFVGEKSTICNKSSGSSYNSPIGRCSPLMSPSGADPAGRKALNLDPSCPQVPDDVYREFKEFKQQKQLEALKALSESFKKELEPRSPRTAASLTAAPAPKKSSLNLYLKEFKLNPNAKAFTPSSCLKRATPVTQHPAVLQIPVFMKSAVPAVTTVQGSHGNLPTVAQENQFSQYNHAVASALVAANPTPYMQSPGVSVPGFPVPRVGGGGILSGQPSMRISPPSQQQAMSSFGHHHQVKYSPPTSSLQPGFLHSNGQLYSQHMIFGQPANPVVFMPYPQCKMQGPSALGQGHLCSQPQQNQPRNCRQGDMSA